MMLAPLIFGAALIFAPSVEFDRYPAHLKPCPSLSEATNLEFVIGQRVYSALGVTYPVNSRDLGYPVVQVFEFAEDREASLVIYLPDYSGDATLEVRTASGSIWSANYEIVDGQQRPIAKSVQLPVHTHKVALPRELATRVSELVELYLSDVAYPSEDVITTHDARYDFVGKYRCGSTNTPAPSSPVLPLFNLYLMLAELPTSSAELPTRLEAIDRLVTQSRTSLNHRGESPNPSLQRTTPR